MRNDKSLPPIDELIASADCWEELLDGTYNAQVVSRSGKSQIFNVDASLLNTCHPQLAMALSGLIAWSNSIKRNNEYSLYLPHTLALLKNECCRIRCENGKTKFS